MIRIIYCFTLCFISISAFSQTIVIKGGEIHTGLNQESFIGDILIEGDTIRAHIEADANAERGFRKW